jgi:hypothetical protein
MAYNTYDIGAEVRVSGAYTLVSTSAATDPDVVKLSIKDPSAVYTHYVYGTDVEIVKDSTGNYHADIATTAAGFYYYRWWSTGAGMASQEKRFKARALETIE